MFDDRLFGAELVGFVDNYCSEKGYEDSPAYDLIEGLDPVQVADMIDEYNSI